MILKAIVLLSFPKNLVVPPMKIAPMDEVVLADIITQFLMVFAMASF